MTSNNACFVRSDPERVAFKSSGYLTTVAPAHACQCTYEGNSQAWNHKLVHLNNPASWTLYIVIVACVIQRKSFRDMLVILASEM